jgi:hypothetical protein
MASNHPYNPYAAGHNPQAQVAYPHQQSPPQPAYFTQPTPPQQGYPGYSPHRPYPAYSPSRRAPNNANSAPQAAGHPHLGYFPGQGPSNMNANFAPPNQFPPSQNTNYATYQSYGSAPLASKINTQKFWGPQPGSIATPVFRQNPLPPPASYPIVSQTLQGAPASQFQQNVHVEAHYTENHYTTIYLSNIVNKSCIKWQIGWLALAMAVWLVDVGYGWLLGWLALVMVGWLVGWFEGWPTIHRRQSHVISTSIYCPDSFRRNQVVFTPKKALL